MERDLPNHDVTKKLLRRLMHPLRSCFKKSQASTRQGKNRRESAVYKGVNEHFEPILNAGLCRLRVFKTASEHLEPFLTPSCDASESLRSCLKTVGSTGRARRTAARQDRLERF